MVSHQMHLFYSTGQKVIIWIVFENFKNLCNVKGYKTFLSGVNALFRAEVAKMVSHQMRAFYSIGPKMMLWSVLEHF
jgi:hypothetical protein